jgi:hypothetical protein
MGISEEKSPQLLNTLRHLDVITDGTSHVTLVSFKAVRYYFKKNGVDNAVIGAMQLLASSNIPPSAYCYHEARRAKAVKAGDRAPTSTGREAAAKPAAVSVPEYDPEDLTWRIGEGFPKAMPGRTYTPEELTTKYV